MASITLVNLTADVISINYPLVFIHGYITHSPDSQKYTAISAQNSSTAAPQNIEWPVLGGEFKVLVELIVGENEVKLLLDGAIVHRVVVKYVLPTTPYVVYPVYIVCRNSDGHFLSTDNTGNTIAHAVEKIKFNTRLLQTFTAESLHEHGFPRKTFSVEESAEHDILVHVFHSDLEQEDAVKMSGDELYSFFNKELLCKLPVNAKRKLLVLMSCTRYLPPVSDEEFDADNTMQYAKGHTALGGGCMALFGTGSLHTWAANLSELNARFRDATLIDRRTMFDDSYGRGTHWANYSTTLGATMHELGHAFDLMHTPNGIMARGHDDMDCFFIVKDDNKCDGSNVDMKYKGARWYRSSAVILNYHKWLQPSRPELDEQDEQQGLLPAVTLHPNLIGPFGCSGGNAVSFNCKKWLEGEGLTFGGFVFHWDIYLNGIQFIGTRESVSDSETDVDATRVFSPIHGTTAVECHRTEFAVNHPAERVTAVQVRSGSWIDGIQVTTTKKSSMWMGGCGGDLHRIALAEKLLENWVGSAGEYVEELLFVVKGSDDACMQTRDAACTFRSPCGVRLIEVEHPTRREVCCHHEFISEERAPAEVTLTVDELLPVDEDSANCVVFDSNGEKTVFTVQRNNKYIAELM